MLFMHPRRVRPRHTAIVCWLDAAMIKAAACCLAAAVSRGQKRRRRRPREEAARGCLRLKQPFWKQSLCRSRAQTRQVSTTTPEPSARSQKLGGLSSAIIIRGTIMIQQQLNDAVAIDTAFKSENINQLTEIEKSLASSPHIRQSYSSGDDTLNKADHAARRFKDAESRTVAIRIIRHLANHRFTVHNTRFVLAAVAGTCKKAAASRTRSRCLSSWATPLPGRRPATSRSCAPSGIWAAA